MKIIQLSLFKKVLLGSVLVFTFCVLLNQLIILGAFIVSITPTTIRQSLSNGKERRYRYIDYLAGGCSLTPRYSFP
ncbi:hypothetical protein HHX48_07050 [Salinimonas sp. HHU 13199]|uniref:Uncharacterized protein n=1 Tax=Salinimonas profundi TaxID=2729140 RepID=A0ABR8LN31_9ALTE|nr:hypothetical protein [Salinimonas profundi]MBD3585484.1 hypothetical protein [Salinimonas profundi]